MIRRLELLVLSAIVLVGALSTGLPFLYYLVYLALLVVGGSYLVTRFGLTDLEAGYGLSTLHGHVGDELRLTYTLRNTARLPKLWLEVHNPSSLPGGIPGRAVSLPPRAERTWRVRMPLVRRGHYRVEPLVVRTGDPFGFFEASATVGQGVNVVVYPRIDPLPGWRLPATGLEGSRAFPERTLQATPLATTVRPWAPGDAMNRIHWKTTARHGEIQVKEFELEQTTDVWLFLDLDRAVQAGTGDDGTVELGVRVAASIAERALAENRAVGITVNAHRLTVIPADRGPRQRSKIMQLLAAVDGDGERPLAEVLVVGLPRLRRGMTAVVVTPSRERSWIRPLADLRGRGIGCVVVLVDGAAGDSGGAPDDPDLRAVRYALAEHDLRHHLARPGRPLGEQLVAVEANR
ncbi:MAG TPA: DUF58 domain-containing protein [Candidatus Binatia bacterium]|nr:DUF58 domain-containing protein [Candidatus Binatia bacterium]